jgi:hypothetical protein
MKLRRGKGRAATEGNYFLSFVRTLNFTVGFCDLLTMRELLLRRRRSSRASDDKCGATSTAVIPIRIRPPTSQSAGFSKSTPLFLETGAICKASGHSQTIFPPANPAG